ncbi:MAG: polymer-forming cytoskeletal protein [Betaproteobacteria bacterium]|nr:polymer-forming cytoskeletal protein [Betaproteobacteria bacterium]
MLKSFMQPGAPGAASNSRTDSSRTNYTGYPAKPTESGKPAEAGKAAPAASGTPKYASSSDEGSKLIVGPNIKLKGSEITDCEILVVEGRVEASMNSRDIRIAEGGVFSGKAEIDVAEVRGTFEGDLTARKRLVVYATGRVSGTIRYGALMVEEGGTITGNMATHGANAGVAMLPDTSVQAPVSETVQEKAAELEEVRSGSTYHRGQRRQG